MTSTAIPDLSAASNLRNVTIWFVGNLDPTKIEGVPMSDITFQGNACVVALYGVQYIYPMSGIVKITIEPVK